MTLCLTSYTVQGYHRQLAGNKKAKLTVSHCVPKTCLRETNLGRLSEELSLPLGLSQVSRSGGDHFVLPTLPLCCGFSALCLARHPGPLCRNHVRKRFVRLWCSYSRGTVEGGLLTPLWTREGRGTGPRTQNQEYLCILNMVYFHLMESKSHHK